MKHQGTSETATAKTAWGRIAQDNLDILLNLSNALEEEREGFQIGDAKPGWPNVGDQQAVRAQLLEAYRFVLGGEMAEDMRSRCYQLGRIAGSK